MLKQPRKVLAVSECSFAYGLCLYCRYKRFGLSFYVLCDINFVDSKWNLFYCFVSVLFQLCGHHKVSTTQRKDHSPVPSCTFRPTTWRRGLCSIHQRQKCTLRTTRAKKKFILNPRGNRLEVCRLPQNNDRNNIQHHDRNLFVLQSIIVYNNKNQWTCSRMWKRLTKAFAVLHEIYFKNQSKKHNAVHSLVLDFHLSRPSRVQQ